jgi:hypothetical protein
MGRALLPLLPFVLAACGEGGGTPVFPADYEATYTEVRDCRQSGDHDLNMVRVLADPAALEPYRDRDEPFPEGAVVIKVQYDFGDADCGGPVSRVTAMEKLATGSDPDNLDWFWQSVDGDGTVLDEQLPRCAGCHQGCGAPPDGYDGTCTIP